MKNILAEYHRIYQELLDHKADLADARALAAALAASNSSDPSQASAGQQRLHDLKSAPSSTTYHHRGIPLRIIEAKINVNSNDNPQVALRFECKVGRTDKELRIKGDQAFRVLSLILLKYEDFEQDLTGGFDCERIRAREAAIVSALAAQKIEVQPPTSGNQELNRAIREKFSETLNLNFLSTDYRSFRIEFAPHHISFRQNAYNFVNELANGRVGAWFDEYEQRHQVAR